ncbi:hypothetical protein KAFR_0A08570 [Kazachstania africana CBS 2517]|uniref:Uncharacterized protein n=1 Tax=Kazachstania africana (strain ATCC 22294 / BCRC 22015 / CBS 2517 / CECT 1963 / NBRC 1671 / NRRL Y-8276) TaxID=1071382 RepID=H2APJ1_KAZAF|nr:hypothetical protein KAFR_0A08570 [Kazachstania africana CBS 2517]CCF56291.1 hypothetical protein KAFR_0A08570 [Kazachstania africana CBS 2517]
MKLSLILSYLFIFPISLVYTSSIEPTTSRERPDPSTAFTPPPKVPVTTLSVDSYYTYTDGTTTYTSLREATDIWVTITSNGVVFTTSTTYIQRFSSQYTSIATPSAGSIGLGTISGTVGIVREPLQLTISNAAVNKLSHSGKLFGLLTLLLTWFI